MSFIDAYVVSWLAYLHNISTLLLMKQISKEKNHWGQRLKAGRIFGLEITPVNSYIYMI